MADMGLIKFSGHAGANAIKPKNGMVCGEPSIFGGVPIHVVTNPATNLLSVSAILNGKANPNGAPTHIFFNYGLTNLYGSVTPNQNIGAGALDVLVSANITGLLPSTLYHFQIVAVNAFGTVTGLDITFTTPAPLIRISALNLSINNSLAGAIDTNLHIGYIGNRDLAGAKISKVDLTTMTELAVLPLPATGGSSYVNSMGIDLVRGKLYAVSPSGGAGHGYVTKIDLATFTVDNTADLLDNNIFSCAMDIINNKLFVHTTIASASLYTVSCAPMTFTKLVDGFDSYSMIVDQTGTFLYVNSGLGLIQKYNIGLAIYTATLSTGIVGALTGTSIDALNLYVSNNNAPSNLFKIDLGTFTLSATYNAPESTVYSLCLDASLNYIVYTCALPPAEISLLKLSDFATHVFELTLNAGENNTQLSSNMLDSVPSFVYNISSTAPVILTKIQVN